MSFRTLPARRPALCLFALTAAAARAQAYPAKPKR